jgi:hypothetical protein
VPVRKISGHRYSQFKQMVRSVSADYVSKPKAIVQCFPNFGLCVQVGGNLKRTIHRGMASVLDPVFGSATAIWPIAALRQQSL